MEDTKPARRDDVIVQLRADLRCIQPALPSTWPDSLLFQADLGLDSLDLFELVARLEQRYQILIDDTDLPGFVSIDAIADFVCAQTDA